MRPEPLTVLGQAELGPYLHLTLAWPEGAPVPAPGQHIELDDGTTLWPLREARDGWLEALASTAPPPGATATLAGEPLACPAGELVLVAEGLGLAPLIHLCEHLRATAPRRLLALYEPPHPLPFRPRPSRFLIQGMPAGAIAAIPLLEDWGIPSRLACPDGLPGAFEGGAEALLSVLPLTAGTSVFAFGDTPFLARVSARHLHLGRVVSVS